VAGWLDSYRAAKAGVPPTYQGQPQYQQPVPQGPPAHAPFGYDPNTGLPVAPYGRDQSGNIIVPQQQPVAFDPRGLPQPQGYGQAPYGQVPGQYPQQQFQPQDSGPQVLDAQGHVHYMDAAAHFRGTKEAQADSADCPNCTVPDPVTGGRKPGVMMRRTGSKIMNTNTGIMVEPAPVCTNCGYNGKFEQSGAGSGMEGMVTQVEQGRHYGRGGASETQAAHIHGMRNLFAKDNPQRGRGRRN
jgi:hypothetical protein